VVVRGLRVAVVVMIGLTAPRAHAQLFAPGKLSRAHASLEGLSSCGRCHAPEAGKMAPRCLTCHTEIAATLEQKAGFHGLMAPILSADCQRCHADHRGRDFDMIDWQGARKDFDHQRAGWPLAGKHAAVACTTCHEARRVTSPEIQSMLRAQRGRETFLGLWKRCDTCHQDEHRDQVVHECQRCHDERSWKPAPRFDHAATAFPLRGKHAGVACAGCHATLHDNDPAPPAFPARRAATYLRLSPIDHGTCAACHADPHAGTLGAACASCHNEQRWRPFALPDRTPREFHERTRFPLEGAHASVGCRSCHGPFDRHHSAKYKGLAFKSCGDCHADGHVGQLASSGDAKKGSGLTARDCNACHTQDAFVPPLFEAEQHDKTRFPLEGSHRALACRACHPIDPRLGQRVPAATRSRLDETMRPLLISLAVMRPEASPERCSSCHADPHGGQFAAEMKRQDCGGCHTTSSFEQPDVRFDHAKDTRFPLTGAHAGTACGSCHKRESFAGAAAPVVRYRPMPTTCGGCHRDRHLGQFTWQLARPDAFAPPARRKDAKDCGACHPTTRFTETSFRHDDARFTTFALEGRHAELACGACHREVRAASDVTAVRYRPLPRTCSGCHADFHRGDFRGLAQ
jgi:hypothetical protein